MKLRFKKIKLVFCPHSLGKLAYSNEIQQQPPLGILTIASYIKNRIPEIEIEVIDGKLLSENEILSRLDSEFVGFSIWFSNYENTIKTIQKLKSAKPWVKIAIGGPHVAFLAEKIIMNNTEIDFVFKGESEVSFSDFIACKPIERIPGILYRNINDIICENPLSYHKIDLNTIPFPDLNLLYPKYVWEGNTCSHAMAAFPISGIRGCNRKDRCEYCSIPLTGYRMKDPRLYLREIKYLYNQFRINYFFETGDNITIKFLKELSIYVESSKIAMRIYAYPGQLKKDHIPILKNVGIKTIFMGIESILIWQNNFKRKYNGCSLDNVINTIKDFMRDGIKTIPSFIIGLEGENDYSLNKNIAIIEELAGIYNIDEITISKIIPLPGTEYFNKCIKNNRLLQNYFNVKNVDLLLTDNIDFILLGQLFIKHFTLVREDIINEKLKKLNSLIGQGHADWSSIN